MKLAVLVVLLVTLLAVPTFAYDWVTNPANGHRYAVIEEDSYSWSVAETLAVGEGGHLVTINDSQENEWIRTHFQGFDFMWIGLHEIVFSPRTWVWTSGEQVAYLNWGSGEPSGPGWEHWVALMGPSLHDGQWADLSEMFAPQDTFRHIALIEVVPEPTSLFALFSGITIFGILRRR